MLKKDTRTPPSSLPSIDYIRRALVLLPGPLVRHLMRRGGLALRAEPPCSEALQGRPGGGFADPALLTLLTTIREAAFCTLASSTSGTPPSPPNCPKATKLDINTNKQLHPQQPHTTHPLCPRTPRSIYDSFLCEKAWGARTAPCLGTFPFTA